jgi:glycosyltransferase involved in cell wall biosynthesis
MNTQPDTDQSASSPTRRFARADRSPFSSTAGRHPRWPRVSVVVPTLNEARNLSYVLPRLPSFVYEVVLVDGRSTDGTVDVARALRSNVRVVYQTGRGKGDALRAGFAAARGDVIVMLDADGSADPAEIPAFLDALLSGADLAKGSRFVPGGGSSDITRLRRAGNTGLNRLVNFIYRTDYTDLCYGYNAFWRACLPQIALDCNGFEVETQLNLRAAKAGLRVVEVPSFEAPRIHGQSNLRTFRDGFRVLRMIFSESGGRRPSTHSTSTPIAARSGRPSSSSTTSISSEIVVQAEHA